MNPASDFRTTPSRTVSLLILGGMLFLGLCLASLAGQAFATLLSGNERAVLLAQSVLQAMFGFILPSWLAFRLTGSRTPWKNLGACTGVSCTAIILAIMTLILALPMLNEIINLNEGIRFPDSIDKTFRAWENEAGRFTDTMLDTTSPGGLIAGIIIVGVLTGFAEEIFFRGALQKMLIGPGMSPQGAVWTAALVFSIMHFQPFGFIPRLLLGAFFGYLYLWSGSIWLSATAHAINNSVVVLTTWLALRGHNCYFIETWGTGDTLWLSFISLIFTSGAIILCLRFIRGRQIPLRYGKNN